MKLRTKRLLSIGLAAAMTVGLLAGCGKKGGSGQRRAATRMASRH